MKKNKSTLFSLILVLFMISCNSNKTITIDKSDFGDNSFVILDLKSGDVVNVVVHKNKFMHEELRGDLFIEPDDPELSGLPDRFEGVTHLGEATSVKYINLPYEDINKNTEEVNSNGFKMRLSKSEIKIGSSFIVKSSHKELYKVNIVDFDPSNKRVELKYSLL